MERKKTLAAQRMCTDCSIYYQDSTVNRESRAVGITCQCGHGELI